MKFSIELADKSLDIDVDAESSTYNIDETSKHYEFTQDNGRFMLRRGTKLYRIDNVKVEGSTVEFTLDSSWYKVAVKNENQILLDKLGFKTSQGAGEGNIASPMPGKILDIMVEVGDDVKKGQPVIILEAMKMENELKSPIDGIIKKLNVSVGQIVEKKTPILEIEAIG